MYSVKGKTWKAGIGKTLEENEENEKLLDEYEQIASEGKQTLMILKGKINEKFQNEEKVKKSEEENESQRKKKEKENTNLRNKKSNLKRR